MLIVLQLKEERRLFKSFFFIESEKLYPRSLKSTLLREAKLVKSSEKDSLLNDSSFHK